MKTLAEVKFDNIIKHGFHEILKPYGFKKRGNNFYLQLEDLGQIINIQKSRWGSKDHISFTINTGIFLPEHWRGLLCNAGKEMPGFPTEPECLIRNRIGSIRKQHDTWYDVNDKADEGKLITAMKENLEQYILPYFKSLRNKRDVLNFIDADPMTLQPIGKLVVYGELNLIEKAKAEYEKMFEEDLHPQFLETLKQYGLKYGLS